MLSHTSCTQHAANVVPHTVEIRNCAPPSGGRINDRAGKYEDRRRNVDDKRLTSAGCAKRVRFS